MVEILPDYPPHVMAYKAAGTVNSQEYKQIVMSRVDEVATKFGKINFLVRLETKMEHYSIRALMLYVRISFRHFKKWERMAIVTDETWIRWAYLLLSPIVHGELRSYRLKDYNRARNWVMGPLTS